VGFSVICGIMKYLCGVLVVNVSFFELRESLGVPLWKDMKKTSKGGKSVEKIVNVTDARLAMTIIDGMRENAVVDESCKSNIRDGTHWSCL